MHKPSYPLTRIAQTSDGVISRSSSHCPCLSGGIKLSGRYDISGLDREGGRPRPFVIAGSRGVGGRKWRRLGAAADAHTKTRRGEQGRDGIAIRST